MITATTTCPTNKTYSADDYGKYDSDPLSDGTEKVTVSNLAEDGGLSSTFDISTGAWYDVGIDDETGEAVVRERAASKDAEGGDDEEDLLLLDDLESIDTTDSDDSGSGTRSGRRHGSMLNGGSFFRRSTSKQFENDD